MINVSTAFKQALANDQRNYLEYAEIRLSSGQTLMLENKDIWDGGFSIDDSVSSDDNFDIGAAIINKASLTINNMYDDFSTYDFNDAIVILHVGLDLDGTIERVKKGTFIVDDADYNGSIIRLSCLDYMSKFDRPYSDSKLAYPATLDEIIRNACSVCGVSLNTYDFPHKTHVIQKRPSEESTTFREVISAVAQIAGCFCRCNTNGALELRWYNQAALEQQYSTLDGGYFDGGKSTLDRVSDYLNTTDGMTPIVDGVRHDDRTFELTGVDWFVFDGDTASTIYVNSNSWVNFGRTPTSASASSTGQLNICRRDGQMHYLYRQEGSIDGLSFLKIRFEGYTSYQSSSATQQYANKWELFLLADGSMIINMVQTPTLANFLGTSNLICGSQTLVLSLADGTGNTPIVGLTYSSGAWSESSEKYMTGDIADGGSFNPWNTGYTADSNAFDAQADVHNLYSNYSMNVSTDDVVITGVRISVKIKDAENKDLIKTYEKGTDGYVLGIEDNPLITVVNASSIVEWLGTQLIGFRFRKASVDHSSDPSIEAGDVAILFDRNGRTYPFVISRTVFQIGNAQTSSSSAETPKKNSAARYTAETKNYVALRQQIEEERTERELALAELAERLAENGGLYSTVESVQTGGSIFYLHNKPTLKESNIVWKMTAEAWAVTTDYQGDETNWNAGMTVDGDTIVRILTATGINADWINSGAINIKKGNNETFYANSETGVVRIVADSFSLSNGDTLDSIKRLATAHYGTCSTSSTTSMKIVVCDGFKLYNGATITVSFTNAAWTSTTSSLYIMMNVNNTGGKYVKAKGSYLYGASNIHNWQANSIVTFVYDGSDWNITDTFNQTEIFNKLTNGGASKGIFMSGNQLYVNMDYLRSGVVKIGGANNGNGQLEIYNSSGTRVGLWNNGALYVGNVSGTSTTPSSPNTKIGTNGEIITNSLTANNYIYVDGNENSLLKIPYKDGNVTGNVIVSKDGLRAEHSSYRTNITGSGINVSNPNSSSSSHVYISQSSVSIDPNRDAFYTGMQLTSSRFTIRHQTNAGAYYFVRMYDSSSSIIFGTSSYPCTVDIYGTLKVDGVETKGKKSRLVTTKDYGDRLLYCYETPTPLFGDVGEGVISEDGLCYVQIEGIFAETVSLNQYQVFLQKYGDGDCWVKERKTSHFVVEGTPNLEFGWEIKARQFDLDQLRLEKSIGDITKVYREPEDESLDYSGELIKHIENITKEREVLQ